MAVSKNPGAGCHVPLQGAFPTQGSNPWPQHWQADSSPLSHQGSPEVRLDLQNSLHILSLIQCVLEEKTLRILAVSPRVTFEKGLPTDSSLVYGKELAGRKGKTHLPRCRQG